MKQELGSRWRTAAKQMRQWAVPPRRGRGPTSGACCSKRNTERNDAERTEEGLLRRFFCALMRQAIPNFAHEKADRS